MDAIARLLREVFDERRSESTPAWKPFLEYRDRPVEFVYDHFGERAIDAQRHAFHELYKHRRLAWRGPRKCSKSRWFTWLVLHFMCTRPSVVITLGPSWDQIRNVIWSGIGELHAIARDRGRPLPGKVDATQWRLAPRHFAIGRATNDPNKLQGFHGSTILPEDPDAPITEEELDALLLEAMESGGGEVIELLVICDETAGIAQILLDSMSGSMQGINTYWALGFNPTLPADSEHLAASVFRDPGEWRTMSSHPYEVDDPVRSHRRFTSIPVGLQKPSWRAEQARRYGRNSPHYRAHVEGLFAGANLEQQVISLELLEGALLRRVNVDTGRHIGVDLSRMGEDRSVAVLTVNGVVRARHEWGKCKTPVSRETIKALMVRWGEPMRVSGAPDEIESVPSGNVHLDAGTFGVAVADELHNEGYRVDAVDFGGGAIGDWSDLHGPDAVFLNRRAELHWNARRLIQEGLAQVPRELDGRRCPIWDEAQWPAWVEFEKGGRTVLRIEPKDKIKARHGRSPDNLDAWLLSLCMTAKGPRLVRRG